MENRASEISSEYEELLDSFSEEEKESDSFTEEKDGFVAANISKEIKQIKADIRAGEKFDIDSFEMRILKYEELSNEEKKIKASIKTKTEELEIKTKETIETLSDAQANMLLEKKWIEPIYLAIMSMPETVVDNLVAEVTKLSKKYETTLTSIENEITNAEQELSAMLDMLVGNEFDMKGLSEFKALLMGE